MENFLREYKGITINVNDDNTMSFISDFLFQALKNKADYEYNGEILNITEIKRLPNDKCLNITFEKKIYDTVKEIIDKPKRTYKPRENKFFNKAIIITGMMPPAMLKRYNLHIDERFETKKELCEHVGLTPQAIDNWLKNGWIKLEKKEHGNKGKTSPYQENRGYISDDGRKRISEARSKEYNERLEGEIIVTDKLPEKLQKQYGIKPEDIFENWEALMNKINKSKKTVDNWRKAEWIEIVK